jgi:hypothetical protein
MAAIILEKSKQLNAETPRRREKTGLYHMRKECNVAAKG